MKLIVLKKMCVIDEHSGGAWWRERAYADVAALLVKYPSGTFAWFDGDDQGSRVLTFQLPGRWTKLMNMAVEGPA